MLGEKTDPRRWKYTCLKVALGIAAIAWIPSPSAAAFSGQTEITGCVGLSLARKPGSPTCWAAWDLAPHKTLCLSQAAWLRWLSQEQTPPPSLCGRWVGKWKLHSPAINTPLGPEDRRPLKPTALTFQAVDRIPLETPGTLENPGTLVIIGRWSRQRIELAREKIDAELAPHDPSGLLRELVTGSRPMGNPLDILRLLGFVHLLVASGIHLYALARVWEMISKNLFVAWSGIPLPWAQRLTTLGTACIWLLSWALAGARPGMLRPWFVIALRAAARKLGLKWRLFSPLVLALLLGVAMNAWRQDPWTSGLWIYALVCGGALLASTAPWVAVGSWLLAAGIEAARSGTLAVATPLLSLITLRVFAGIFYPLTLFACLTHACGFEPIAQLVLGLVGSTSSILLDGAFAAVAQLRLVWLVSHAALAGGAMLGGAVFFTCARTRWVMVGGIVILRLFLSDFSTVVREAQPAFAQTVEQLDVGQGDAALVRAATARNGDQFGLIDTGSEHALGERAWIELLALRGVRRLEWIALTHLDEDHSGGVKRLGLLVPIGCVATARAELASDRGQKYKADLEHLGIRVTDWSGGCVPFPTLAPFESKTGDELNTFANAPLKSSRSIGKSKANQNMGAIFIPLASGGFYLSPGDADAEDEPRIGAWAAELARKLAQPGPRILKISHHGSKTSSNPFFIEEVRPTETWISVGAGNRYGHPASSVLEELRAMHLPVSRTDQTGSLRVGGESVKSRLGGG